MCPPKPQINTVAPPAAPPSPVTPETPELAFNDKNPLASRRRMGRMQLRTDKNPVKKSGVQMPQMKSIV